MTKLVFLHVSLVPTVTIYIVGQAPKILHIVSNKTIYLSYNEIWEKKKTDHCLGTNNDVEKIDLSVRYLSQLGLPATKLILNKFPS